MAVQSSLYDKMRRLVTLLLPLMCYTSTKRVHRSVGMEYDMKVLLMKKEM